jgi:uncharacterized protein YciI
MNRYLVLVMRNARFDPAAVQPHRDFLEGLRAGGRLELSGGFADGSGGAYLLFADDLAQAMDTVRKDPAYVTGGWDFTVHEWHAR